LLCAVNYASSLIHWYGDYVELVYANESVSIATTNPMFWELDNFECFSGKFLEGGFIRISNEGQQPIQAVNSESFF
jgi:hypothetical protein